jgi:serpin B
MNTLAFASNPEAARAHINREVASVTAGQLRELLAPGKVDADTRAVLTSALALSGPWATGFDAAQTRERPFTLADHSVVKVPVMVREGEFALGMLGDDTTVLEIPYAGERLVMDVVLPSSEQGLPPEAFDVDALGRTLERLAPAQVQVSLPRFRAALPSVALKPFFERLGVRALFAPGQADLRGIAGSARELHVAEVFHGTSVVVDERGVSPGRRVKSGDQARMPKVSVDRPFMFLVRDRVSDLILCAGRIDDPSRKD